jgi:hypothetical protein
MRGVWGCCHHGLERGNGKSRPSKSNPSTRVCKQTVNLVLAAGATQAWYRSRFKTYPAERRALIPFVY